MRLHGIDFDLGKIAALCSGVGVARAWLFGSLLTPHFDSQSDIDILIETDPNRPAGLLAIGGLQMDLTDLLGRQVHLTLLGGVPMAERARLFSQARLLDAA